MWNLKMLLYDTCNDGVAYFVISMQYQIKRQPIIGVVIKGFL